jgi:AraC-like DNA-binding protein
VITSRVSAAGDFELHQRPPHPALRPLLHRGYTGYVERLATPLRRLEVPYDAIPVIVNLGPPIDVLGWGSQGAFVAGLSDRAAVTEHGGVQEGIQFDLVPLAARALLGLPPGEIAGQIVALDELVPAALIAHLAELGDWAARFDALDAFLLARMREAAPPRPDVAYAFARLRATHGAIGVGALCAELGCSRRHLTRRFGEEVGLAPKPLARVLRFRRVLALLQADAPLGRVAADAGYFDQPHLNRDFRELAGCTPTEYLARLLPEGRGVTG